MNLVPRSLEHTLRAVSCKNSGLIGFQLPSSFGGLEPKGLVLKDSFSFTLYKNQGLKSKSKPMHATKSKIFEDCRAQQRPHKQVCAFPIASRSPVCSLSPLISKMGVSCFRALTKMVGVLLGSFTQLFSGSLFLFFLVAAPLKWSSPKNVCFFFLQGH